jgi:hypothetical protein
MIDRTRVHAVQPTEFVRDERSMRVVEYAMAVMAFAAALLISFR